MIASIFAAALLAAQPAETPRNLPEIIVDRDNVTINESCRVTIPEGLVIADTDGNGVIQVTGDDIVIDLAGSILRGAPEGTPWDTLTGTGIMVDGQRGVILQNLAVHGYKVGVLASFADALEVTAADLSDNFRQRLGSTPQREDSRDWLFPHHNDANEWATNYGAALYIEESEHVLVRRIRVRRGQNGIILDRVRDSKIFDNDCSFLSGWGLAMWRSTGNTVTRNHFDFCVRGHVEGVYNRGQDSAGILMFEQCSNNIIAENAITHGGDGIFGFGGHDALGQSHRDEARARLKAETGEDNGDDAIAYADTVLADSERAGCNNNVFAFNDLSYAPAHGLEMTFSFDNIILNNRFSENAICGIWGGFSQGTLIMENLFEANGGMGYGLERGGINIEHGASNAIINNRFVNNRAGVHLWLDDLGDFASLPWAKANYHGVAGNVIADNQFTMDRVPGSFHKMSPTERMVGIQLRNDGGDFGPVAIVNNRFDSDDSIAEAQRTSGDTPISTNGPIPGFALPEYTVLGDTRPVTIVDGVPYSTRTTLRGRDQIVMDEWGPWDHESPLLRTVSASGGQAIYDMLGVDEVDAAALNDGYSVTVTDGPIPRSKRITIDTRDGVVPYQVEIVSGDFEATVEGTLIEARWMGRVFSWANGPDPRDDFDGWHKRARFEGSRPFSASSIAFKFGMGGPIDLLNQGVIHDTSGRLAESDIGRDHFGLEVMGRLRMPAGRWKLTTLSDDGIRVQVITSASQAQTVIDNWTWHGPTNNEGEFTVSQDNELVMIRAYYFEIDGYATLNLSLEPTR